MSWPVITENLWAATLSTLDRGPGVGRLSVGLSTSPGPVSHRRRVLDEIIMAFPSFAIISVLESGVSPSQWYQSERLT